MAIEVVIDKDLEDLIPGYLENRKKDIVKTEKSLLEKDFETIRVIGHSMKGSGGGYGFDKISEIGKGIEEAAKSGDVASIQTRLKELGEYVENVRISYN